MLVTFLHVLTAVALIKWFQVAPPVSNGMAFLIANLFSYIINTKWSFSSSLGTLIFMRFLAVSLFGFIISVGIAAVVEYLGFGYQYGVALVVLVIPLVSFVFHSIWTYR